MASIHSLNQHLALPQSWILACILFVAVMGIQIQGASHQRVRAIHDRCHRVHIKYSWFFGFEATKEFWSFLSLASWDSVSWCTSYVNPDAALCLLTRVLVHRTYPCIFRMREGVCFFFQSIWATGFARNRDFKAPLSLARIALKSDPCQMIPAKRLSSRKRRDRLKACDKRCKSGYQSYQCALYDL